MHAWSTTFDVPAPGLFTCSVNHSFVGASTLSGSRLSLLQAFRLG